MWSTIPVVSLSATPSVIPMGSPLENDEYTNYNNLFETVKKFNIQLKRAEEEWNRSICCCRCCFSTYHLQKVNETIEIAKVNNQWCYFGQQATYTQGIANEILNHLSDQNLLPYGHLRDYLLKNEDNPETFKKLFKMYIKAHLISFVQKRGHAANATAWLMTRLDIELIERIKEILKKHVDTVVEEILKEEIEAVMVPDPLLTELNGPPLDYSTVS